MARTKTETPVVETAPVNANAELVAALREAISLTKPKERHTPFTRKIGTPWTPKDGSPKLKLKRKMYQHGIPLDTDILFNEEIDLLNKVRPGVYMDGFVKVLRRRDRGVDIDYPIKTSAQRLKLVNQWGVRNLTDLCAKIIEEQSRPKRSVEDDDI